MTSAFCSAPFGASFTSPTAFAPRAEAPRPRFTASESSSLSPSSSPTPSLPALSSPPSSRSLQSLHPFVAALYRAFSTCDATCMEQLLHPHVRWDTSLFDVNSASRVLDNLDDFLSFAEDPTIAAYHVQTTPLDALLTFSWTLSFNYPLPWRPRVSASGHTTVTFSQSCSSATHIVDEWYTSPLTLISQALPKLTDLFWLYPSPHAETDRGQRKTLRSRPLYTLIHQAPLEEYRILHTMQHFEHELAWAIPTLPERAFEGGLRKLEQYSAVSPIALRLVDDRHAQPATSLLYECALPVPTTLTGSSALLAPFPGAKDARIVNVPRRLMAVSRFGGFSTRTRFKQRLQAVLDALVKDALISGDEHSLQFGGRNVWLRSYDCKVGFNSKGVLSMAMYGGSKGVRRVNEIALDLTDIVTEERARA